jgi:hypothetical protein
MRIHSSKAADLDYLRWENGINEDTGTRPWKIHEHMKIYKYTVVVFIKQYAVWWDKERSHRYDMKKLRDQRSGENLHRYVAEYKRKAVFLYKYISFLNVPVCFIC